ncbi:MAG: PD-(D/E)XK nuclease family protein [Oscillospiraceae bacterium]|nr:PD-(D/E)XK nuclease family protein [Oscillospiraceae bacterium]
MDEGNNFTSEFDAFIMTLNEAKLQKKSTTLPEVFGIQFKEVYITKWIAYFLGHHILGIKMLNALLNINDQNIAITRIEKVYTEYIFTDGRRIDILIFADNYLIGIENKIWSGEQENQTNDYIQSMKKLSSGKETIGVYLHPEENKTESAEFNNVTYQQFLNALLFDNSVSYAEIDQFTYHLYEEFKRYIKECLCMNFPEKSGVVKAYSEAIDVVKRAEFEYNEYLKQISKWLNDELEKQSHGLFRGEAIKNNYWIIIMDERWRNLDFHFEVLWDEKAICDNNTVRLEVHLEDFTVIAKKRDNTKILECFGENYTKRGADNPLYRVDFSCDFSTEEESKNTIKRIVYELSRGTFAEYAQKANKYLEMTV